MEKLYDRIIFDNQTVPALNDTNLNAMSKGIDDIDDRVLSLGSAVLEVVPELEDILSNAEQLQQYRDDALAAATSAEGDEEDAEAYAVGTRGGVPVTSGDPAYHNNSKYYSEQAAPSISNCTDTAISSPTNGQVLTYNGTSDKWENANAQGGGSTVTWTQIQATGTKIAEIDIDGTSTDVYAPSGGSVLVDRTFNVASTDWEANTDPTTETDYPYIAEITTSVYSNTSKPIWQMNGVGTIPTLAEQEEIGYIIEAVFSSSGITLYAIDEPTVALVLEVKGE